ncbi:MAG: riboflavin synthase [Bacteroidia bacterium]|nr:riboflavin synthase [Bacteroidia bacterium]
MFTGIIEQTGTVLFQMKEGKNLRIAIRAAFASELRIDQSVSHNGVCLTVVNINDDTYQVIAIDETLNRSNIGQLSPGSLVNLERSMKIGDRLDGHIVQGHVDTTAELKNIVEQNGSWVFSFEYPVASGHITVEKGSVCVNGVSLTVVDSGKNTFSVAIIPYTWEYTNFHTLKSGDYVNIEFDVIGKYVARILAEKN